MSIPSTQRAAVKSAPGKDSKVEIREVPTPSISSGQILVKITYSGLCGSDLGFYRDKYAAWGGAMNLETTKGIAGHEGAGVVVAVGDDVQHIWKVGDRAGVKYIAGVCRSYDCEPCSNGEDEVLCPHAQRSAVNIPGTFQEYVATDGRYASKIPDGVSDEEAGPILCGGLTVYTALKRSGVRPGQWVVLPGGGGGLGHMAVQYAKAMGMKVIAIDAGDAKKELCERLGAELFIDFTKVSFERN